MQKNILLIGNRHTYIINKIKVLSYLKCVFRIKFLNNFKIY